MPVANEYASKLSRLESSPENISATDTLTEFLKKPKQSKAEGIVFLGRASGFKELNDQLINRKNKSSTSELQGIRGLAGRGCDYVAS
jgi:hypothetical protein